MIRRKLRRFLGIYSPAAAELRAFEAKVDAYMRLVAGAARAHGIDPLPLQLLIIRSAYAQRLLDQERRGQDD